MRVGTLKSRLTNYNRITESDAAPHIHRHTNGDKFV